MSREAAEVLLGEMHYKRKQSAVINRLCVQLEEELARGIPDFDNANQAVHCPVCTAELYASYDTVYENFHLKLPK